ncbi:HNH endonuclease family protein [Nonomuraea sp. NPDC002799]
MFNLRSWHSYAVTALALLALAPSAAAAVPTELPPPLSPRAAYEHLAELDIATPRPMAGYSRSRFPHWSQQGQGCDTRETVLARDGSDVKQDAQCRAISGAWHSVYDGKDFTSAAQIDIDHMVPLAQAWRSGADAWTDAERRVFANDLEGPQLIAVSAASNRSKGDQSPDQWRPPLQSYWCTYSRAWIDIKSRYQLTITEPERDALADMMATCGPEDDV